MTKSFTSNVFEVKPLDTFGLFFASCFFTFFFIELFTSSSNQKQHGLHSHVFLIMLFHLFYDVRLIPFLFVFLDLMHWLECYNTVQCIICGSSTLKSWLLFTQKKYNIMKFSYEFFIIFFEHVTSFNYFSLSIFIF